MASDALPTWSSIADWYDDLLEAGSGPHDTAVRCLTELIPTVEGLDVLDIACGQGYASRALAALGASVTAVDYSESMIANALRRGSPPGMAIDYRVDNAETLQTVANASFDGVTCQLGLMDIPDLDATLHSVARVLRPDGWLAFVIAHPVFLAPDAERVVSSNGGLMAGITNYFEERFWRSSNPEGVRRAGNYHRKISTYLNSLHLAGFTIEHADEPRASALLQQQQPLYGQVPIFFAARARLLTALA